MQVITLIDTASAVTAAPQPTDEGLTLTSSDRYYEGRDEIMMQVDMSGTATVKVYGKIGHGMPWAQLGPDIIASGIYAFARVPKVIAQISAYTSGTVSVLAGV